MKVTANPSITPSPIPGIHHATLAGSEQGLAALSIWTQILDPGAATPPHRHDCEEVILCSAGSGELRFGVDRVLPFGPDDTVTIPRNELHQLVNVGDQPLRIVAAFSRSPVEAYLPDGQLIDLPWSS